MTGSVEQKIEYEEWALTRREIAETWIRFAENALTIDGANEEMAGKIADLMIKEYKSRFGIK